MKAMIMAAGLGTRLLPLTETLSKPMVPVAGRPAIGHLVTLLARHGFTELAANLHYQPGQIRDHLGDGSAYGVGLRYVFEPELSGTAGGVGRFRDFLGDDTFLVISGDALTDIDLTALMAAHKASGGLCTLAVTPVDDPSRYGVVVHDERQRITGFQEKPSRQEAHSNLCSCGIYACQPSIFEYIPKGRFVDFAKDVFPAAMAAGDALYAWHADSYWNDVGSLGAYLQGNADALAGAVSVEIRGDQVRPGIWVAPGADLGDRVQVVPPVLIGAGAEVGAGARLLGPVGIGPRCTVRARATIERSVLWDGCTVGAGVEMRDCILGRDVVIGDGAVVGIDAVIADGCRVEEQAVVEEHARLVPGVTVNAAVPSGA